MSLFAWRFGLDREAVGIKPHLGSAGVAGARDSTAAGGSCGAPIQHHERTAMTGRRGVPSTNTAG